MENTDILDRARERLKQAEATGDPQLIHLERLHLRAIGRKLALESGGALGWCSHFEELLPAEEFTSDRARKGGLSTYSRRGLLARRHLRAKTKAEPVPAPAVPEESRTSGGRKCRRKSCGRRWTPAEGDTSRVCPPCRGGTDS